MAAERDKSSGGKSTIEILSVRGFGATYGTHRVFADVDFDCLPGSLTALVGPNGSGKTTLLHGLCGIHRETTGEVRLLGVPVTRLSRREVARQMALVSQVSQTDFAVTVEETVSLGRYPWVGPLAPLRPVDQAAIEEALSAMDLEALRRRKLSTLSGGERQRVLLARALAQETPVLLLDEPVANLDLRYQQETYERLRGLATTRGATILVTDHHLNLVAATCSRLLVLHRGHLWADGPPEEIVTEAMIATVFGARMQVERRGGRPPQCVWEF